MSNMRRTADGSVMLAVTATALPPDARIAAATASASSVRARVFTATVSPSRARCSAMTAPRPLPAPVTSAMSAIAGGHGRPQQFRDVGELVDVPAGLQQPFGPLGAEHGSDQLAELRIEFVVAERRGGRAAVTPHLGGQRSP